MFKKCATQVKIRKNTTKKGSPDIVFLSIPLPCVLFCNSKMKFILLVYSFKYCECTAHALKMLPKSVPIAMWAARRHVTPSHFRHPVFKSWLADLSRPPSPLSHYGLINKRFHFFFFLIIVPNLTLDQYYILHNCWCHFQLIYKDSITLPDINFKMLKWIKTVIIYSLHNQFFLKKIYFVW